MHVKHAHKETIQDQKGIYRLDLLPKRADCFLMLADIPYVKPYVSNIERANNKRELSEYGFINARVSSNRGWSDGYFEDRSDVYHEPTLLTPCIQIEFDTVAHEPVFVALQMVRCIRALEPTAECFSLKVYGSTVIDNQEIMMAHYTFNVQEQSLDEMAFNNAGYVELVTMEAGRESRMQWSEHHLSSHDECHHPIVRHINYNLATNTAEKVNIQPIWEYNHVLEAQKAIDALFGVQRKESNHAS